MAYLSKQESLIAKRKRTKKYILNYTRGSAWNLQVILLQSYIVKNTSGSIGFLDNIISIFYIFRSSGKNHMTEEANIKKKTQKTEYE